MEKCRGRVIERQMKGTERERERERERDSSEVGSTE